MHCLSDTGSKIFAWLKLQRSTCGFFKHNCTLLLSMVVRLMENVIGVVRGCLTISRVSFAVWYMILRAVWKSLNVIIFVFRYLRWSELLLLAVTSLYLISPIDFIPDFIPVLGWIDDIGILMIVGFQSLVVVSFLTRCVTVGRAHKMDHQIPPVQGMTVTSWWHADECAVCLGDSGQVKITFHPCGHRYCRRCAEEVECRRMPCPLCREGILHMQHD
mmetsp:Transcript_53329/g.88408  ORF Transcript_53329/g.88408 Transcript_53329/m.88408 type:complete len:217 (-) Transcript_53329:170-820(-)